MGDTGSAVADLPPDSVTAESPNLKSPDPAEMPLWPDWLVMMHAANCLEWPKHEQLVGALRARAMRSHRIKKSTPPAGVTHSDLIDAARILSTRAEFQTDSAEEYRLRSLANRLFDAGSADPNP
ncbi:hypothetical protein [Mycolicibacterium vanbaalenii]|uniref:hypothetical protein n=1 Tax=Mycolicibacterium vanbaalenii TaxID=110539 RepID=UPI00132FE088|nr:hypothetical protein [Mycolicibacterium vanbaalenii]